LITSQRRRETDWFQASLQVPAFQFAGDQRCAPEPADDQRGQVHDRLAGEVEQRVRGVGFHCGQELPRMRVTAGLGVQAG
jgi:hypothetical protein